MRVQPDLGDTLRELVGNGCFRVAGESDEIDGVRARWLVEPRTISEVSTVLKTAHDYGLKVIPRGGGTKIAWGRPPERIDIILSTRRLSHVIEHQAGDLVVRAEAGVRLGDLQVELARKNQKLALDPPESDATLGGIVATNAYGPSRLRYGSVRDQLIGVTVALADGTIAKAGGKVVKNVAGYDLCKLITGSFGTLTVVLETTFRLYPLPAMRQQRYFAVHGPDQVEALQSAFRQSPLVPVAMNLYWDGTQNKGAYEVVFEGSPEVVEAECERGVRFARQAGCAPTRWKSQPYGDAGSGVTLKLAYPISALPKILSDLKTLELSCHLVSYVGTGTALMTASSELEADQINVIRQVVHERGGTTTLLQAPLALKRCVDVWGYEGDAGELMQRVKDRFDPQHVLSPGRFI